MIASKATNIPRKKLAGILALGISALLLQSAPVYADEALMQAELVSVVHPHRISLGGDLFLLQFDVHFQGATVSSRQVFRGPLSVRYEYLKPGALYVGVDVFGARGSKGFRATYKRMSLPRNSGKPGFGYFETRLGYTLGFARGMVTPFLAFGAHGFSSRGRCFHFCEDIVYNAIGLRSLFAWSRTFGIGWNGKLYYADGAERKFKFLPREGMTKCAASRDVWGAEIGVPLVWSVGAAQRWEVQLEPYLLRLDLSEFHEVLGVHLLLGYRF